jgi:heme-degrading monooxygenase HmoA
MVRHVALWTLTEKARSQGALAEAAEKINASARMMLGEVPGLLYVEVAHNIAEAPHDLVLYSEFESEQALQVYQTHAAHIAHKERVKDYVSNREIIDWSSRLVP